MKTLFLSTSTGALMASALIAPPAIAVSKIVTINELAITNGSFTIQVPSGDGIVLDLSEVSQTVKGAVFGDPTKFVISGIDGQLCYMQKDKCEATGASVVLFRPVIGVEISTQSHSPDGSTTATLITDGKLGSKVLHMLLIPTLKGPYTAIVARKDFAPKQPVVASSRIDSSQLEPDKLHVSELPRSGEEHGENGKTNSLVVVPTYSADSATSAPSPPITHNDTPKPLLSVPSQQLAAATAEHQPLFPSNNFHLYQTEVNSVATVLPTDDTANLQKPVPQEYLPLDSSRVNSESTSATSDSLSFNPDESNSINDAYTVALGVLVAKKIGWIKPQTIVWNKVQKAIAQLLQGENRTDAPDSARLDPKVLNQLLTWGRSAIALLRQGQNLESIADLVRANIVRDSEKTRLLKQLFEWEFGSQ